MKSSADSRCSRTIRLEKSSLLSLRFLLVGNFPSTCMIGPRSPASSGIRFQARNYLVELNDKTSVVQSGTFLRFQHSQPVDSDVSRFSSLSGCLNPIEALFGPRF